MSDRQKLMMFWPLAGFFVAAAFGVGVISEAAFNANRSAPVSSAQTDSGTVVQVELGDLFVKPEAMAAEAGPVTFEVHNAGKVEHNFSIDGLGSTEMIPPGGDATLEVPSAEAGTYEFICQVAGHADGGMKGTLTVRQSGSSEAAAAGTSGAGHMGAAGHMMSPEKMAAHDAAVTESFPVKTEGAGGAVLKPKVLADGTKRFDLTAEVVEWEVAPGEFKEAWAYNGMVPGPTLKANLGDRVRIVLNNELPEPTTIHFHGMTVPANMDGVPVISQDAVMPGEGFAYEFTVRNTGTNMYHSHFNAQKQVPLGLLGAFVVPDPKDPEVDVDVNMVLNDGPLGFTLNGKGFPATAPVVANRGDVMRIRYMNEGLMIHPMHLHGMPQKVIAVDGHLLKDPYWADTVMVAPGQRMDVLVKVTEPGTWAFHCHILNHAEGPDGMFGMVTALVVNP